MTTTTHLVIGAGAVGTATALLLAGRGEPVRLVSRSGRGPDHPAIERVAADAADAVRMTRLADGAAAIYNCANPAYHRWSTDWPPIAAALLTAAEQAGPVLATVSNLYVYAPPDGPMSEHTPLAPTTRKGAVRARMWQEALAAHQAGRIRATEVRGSDYIGPHSQSQFAERAVPRILAGRAVGVLGDPDAPHTYTYTGDVARLLVTVAADPRAWGRPWHVPSHPATTSRAVITQMCDLVGRPPVPVRRHPDLLLTLGGLVAPMLRELKEVRYQHDRPFVMDSTAARTSFRLEPTPWREILTATLAAHGAMAPDAGGLAPSIS